MDLTIARCGGAQAFKRKESVRLLIIGQENRTLFRQDMAADGTLLILETEFDIRLRTGIIGTVGRNNREIQLMLIS